MLFHLPQASGDAEKMESEWASRTIVVSGIPEDVLPIAVMADKLTIHFLRPRNGGGEVENVVYPCEVKGNAYVTFEEEKVVESVLKKDEQALEDKALPSRYPLKVSRYRVDVFTRVSVDLDLSSLEPRMDVGKLLRDLQSNNKSLHFSARGERKLHVDGTFTAIKELRKDLLSRIAELPPRRVPKPAGKDGPQAKESRKSCPPAPHEEATIILDSDIFRYMDMFCKEEYEGILRKQRVTSRVSESDDLTTIQLEEAGDLHDASQLTVAKFSLEMLINRMQQLLVSEKVRLEPGGAGGQSRGRALEICEDLKPRFPTVLVHRTAEHVTLIGSSSESYQFRREVENELKSGQTVGGGELKPPGQSTRVVAGSETTYRFSQGLSSADVGGLRADTALVGEYYPSKKSHVDPSGKRLYDSLAYPCGAEDGSGKRGGYHSLPGPLAGGTSALALGSHSFSTRSSSVRDGHSVNPVRSPPGV
ncbi:RNA-binding protein 43 [Callorhinchus milii]|uniref:RNA-binding protein 43 n=1 Tax=Callorhinchus milii TaxID=7868 RepID=UPI001C3FC097|nr:RNA-binding protein 43 [Callorhinchus milii]